MKAAVFVQKDKLEYRDVSPIEPGPDEVLVRVTGCGVCGTDVHILHGQITEGIAPPVVLGHEIAGIIEKVGADVTHLRVGQNVAVDPVITCKRCYYCQTGQPNLCHEQQNLGYKRNGGFAQFCCVPATHIVRLSDGVRPQAGILVETLACVLNGYDRLEPRPGSSALILGAGTVGLLWTQLLSRAGLAPLAVSEPVAFRRELASELGADVVLDPTAGNLQEQLGGADFEGFDYVVDASGEPGAVEQGIQLVRRAGTFMIFGVCPRDSQIRLNPFDLYQKQMKIIASKMPPLRLPRAARIIEAGQIDYATIVTQTWPLERLGEAVERFETARDKQVKVMIDPWAA